MGQTVVCGRGEEIRIRGENPRRTPYLFSLWSLGPRPMVLGLVSPQADAAN